VHPRQPTKTKKNSPQSQTPKGTTQPSLRGRALRLLGRREFSRQELEHRLRDHAESPAELETLLDDLTGRGWLSDARYADAVVRRRAGQYARRSIAQELKRAGVDEDVTAAALAQNSSGEPDEEFAAALALCQRKFRKAPIDQKEQARQIRFLQSRGYGFGLALRVIKQLGAQGLDIQC
jgi:regulatory protein